MTCRQAVGGWLGGIDDLAALVVFAPPWPVCVVKQLPLACSAAWSCGLLTFVPPLAQAATLLPLAGGPA